MATVTQSIDPQSILNAIIDNAYFILSYDELINNQLYYINKFHNCLYYDAHQQALNHGVAIILEITDYKLGELTVTPEQRYILIDPSRLIPE